MSVKLGEAQFTAFGGTTAVWQFEYQAPTIKKHWDHDGQDNTVTTCLLTRIVLPDQSDINLSYYHGAPGRDINREPCDFGTWGSTLSGAIKSITLPAGGKHEFCYGAYAVNGLFDPRADSDTDHDADLMTIDGVVARRTLDHDGYPIGYWKYEQTLVDTENSTILPDPYTITKVTQPEGSYTENFFHLSRDSNYDSKFYGQPFATHLPLSGSGPPYLSQRIYGAAEGLMREIYVEYVASDFVPLTHHAADTHLVKSREIFYDETGPHVGDYRETAYTGYDALGHFRTQSLSGDWGGGDNETYTNYNPNTGSCTFGNVYPCNNVTLPGPSDPWILGLFDKKWVKEGSNKAQQGFCFDENTGFLKGQRAYKQIGSNITESDDDVVTLFTRDISGADSVILNDYLYGADTGNNAPSDICAPRPAGEEYHVRKTLKYGALERSEFICNGAPVLVTADNTIDYHTGLASQSRDPSGLSTNYIFDELGRITDVLPSSSSGLADVSYTYTADPAKIEVKTKTSIGGLLITDETYYYDGQGRFEKYKTLFPSGNYGVREVEYDDESRVKRRSEQQQGSASNWTSFQYDGLGRPTRATRPDGSVIKFSYDGDRRKQRQYSVAGIIGEVEHLELYDLQGRLVKVKEPLGGTSRTENGISILGADWSTNYFYNVAGNLVRVEDEFNNTRQSFDWDGRGFMTEETPPELAGQSIIYDEFDPMGNVGTKRTAGSLHFYLAFTYDRAGRPTQVKNGQNNSLLKEFFYGYSNAGSNLAEGKLVKTKRHNYPNDGSGRDLIVSELFEYEGKGGAPSKKTTRFSETFQQQSAREYSQEWSYDDLGNLLKLTFPEAGPERILENTYSRGLLTRVFEVLSSDSSVRDYAGNIQYHENGMLKYLKYGPSGGPGMDYSQGRDPNWMPRIGSIVFDQHLTYANFSYDGVGNLESFECKPIPDLRTENFKYDGVGRLTAHNPCTPTVAFSNFFYDKFGNMTEREDENLTWDVDSATNRVNGYSYDSAGNLTQYGGPTAATYSYDPFNNMESKNNSAGSPEDFYLYTADDERVLIWEEGMNRETIRLRGPGQQLLREYVDGAWTKDWIWRNGVALASITPDGENEEVFHLAPNYLGSVRGILSEDNVALHTPYYLPFGILAGGDSSAAGEIVSFTGHERDFNDGADPEDSLDYMHARHCSSSAGRFMSMDPLGGDPSSPQSWNLFSYVQNNPINYLDPRGETINLPNCQESGSCEELDAIKTALIEVGASSVAKRISVDSKTGDVIGFTKADQSSDNFTVKNLSKLANDSDHVSQLIFSSEVPDISGAITISQSDGTTRIEMDPAKIAKIRLPMENNANPNIVYRFFGRIELDEAMMHEFGHFFATSGITTNPAMGGSKISNDTALNWENLHRIQKGGTRQFIHRYSHKGYRIYEK